MFVLISSQRLRSGTQAGRSRMAFKWEILFSPEARFPTMTRSRTFIRFND
jgi:hypothetical protein